MSKEMKRYIVTGVTYNPNGKIADAVELIEAPAPAKHPPMLWMLFKLLFNPRAYVFLMWSVMYAVRVHDSVRGTGSSDVLLFKSQKIYRDWVDKTGQM